MIMLWVFSLRRLDSWVIPRHGRSSAAGGPAVFPRAGYFSIPCTPISPIGISTYHKNIRVSVFGIYATGCRTLYHDQSKQGQGTKFKQVRTNRRPCTASVQPLGVGNPAKKGVPAFSRCD